MLPSETEWQGLPLLALPDEVFDFPRTTADEAKRFADMIMAEAERFVPPEYIGKFDIRRPIDDAVERLRDVRMIRAAAAIKFKNDPDLMQVETIRLMQEEADAAFTEANALIMRGALRIRISHEMTIGNYIDAKVRKALRTRYASLDIVESKDGPIRVNRRELEIGNDERSYRRPDARVGSVSFDVTLTRKTNTTPQILGFFNSEDKPKIVAVIRPRQLTGGGTYLITRGGK